LEPLSTVDRALDVLTYLHMGGRAQGVTEIAHGLALPKSTAHRLLAALLRRDFVQRDPGGRYRPGMALVALGVGVLEGEPVVRAARRVLEDEARAAGETVFLAGARAGRLLVLDKEEGAGFLRASPRIGDEIPVHATAVGKLYLAFEPDAVEPGRGTERFTPRTRDPEALAAELGRVRTRGFAENREEWIPGLIGVAAPVRLSDRLVAALAIAGPSSRQVRERRNELIERVVDAAARIEARLLGGRKP
jgi:DNA-binding IclR family transcriptional regulator